MRRGLPILIAASVVLGALRPAAADGFSLRQVHLKDWVAKGEIQKVVGKKLYDLIDGFADIHMGFNYRDSEHLTVRKGKWELEVSVFRVDSPANAYGLYTCLRDRDGELVDVGDEGSYAYGTAVAWRGPYCIEVKDVSEQEAPKEEILAVCREIASTLKGGYERPQLVRALPSKNLDYKGLIYFHHRHPLDQIYYLGTENVLLLGTDAMKPSRVEAVYAEYKLSRGRHGLLVLRYPKGEQARKAVELYSSSARGDAASVENQEPWRVFRTKSGKATVVLCKGRLLMIAFEAAQPDAIKAVMAKIASNLEPPKKKAQKKPGTV